MSPDEPESDVLPAEPQPTTGLPGDPEMPDVETGVDDWVDDEEDDPEASGIGFGPGIPEIVNR